MSGLAGGFSSAANNAKGKGNLNSGHGGDYASSQAAYYTDKKIAAKHQKNQPKKPDRPPVLTIEEREAARLTKRRLELAKKRSLGGVSVEPAKNVEPYDITPMGNRIKVLNVTGSQAHPKDFVNEAIQLAMQGNMVRIEVPAKAKPRFVEYVQRIAIARKLSAEHTERIIISEHEITQNEMFNPNQTAVGDIDQTVRESVKGVSSEPLQGLE